MTMKNFGLVLLAGGAAIVGLGFFMRKGEDADDTGENIQEIDPSKAKQAPAIIERPGKLNVTTEVRIATVTAIHS
jgi:hypothetical protein